MKHVKRLQQHGSKYFANRPPTHPILGVVRNQLFQNMFMLHIKLNRIKNAQHGCKYFYRQTPPPPPILVVGQKVKIQLLQNMVILHIK